jgi:hypothetical protein
VIGSAGGLGEEAKKRRFLRNEAKIDSRRTGETGEQKAFSAERDS